MSNRNRRRGAGLLIALLSILLGGGAAAAAVSAVAAAKGPNDSQSVITGPKNVVAPSQVIGEPSAADREGASQCALPFSTGVT